MSKQTSLFTFFNSKVKPQDELSTQPVTKKQKTEQASSKVRSTPIATKPKPLPSSSMKSMSGTRSLVATPQVSNSTQPSKTPQTAAIIKKYEQLMDEDKIRDCQGRYKCDPEYDGRTLFVPDSFYQQATPFEKQYWEIKSQHYNTVVFFKKGKFYELFAGDADLGNSLFDLKLTDRGAMRMVGVPEASFDLWAGKFVAAGYKVAKVEQKETQIGKEMREKAAGAKDDIVKRELTVVLTAGTLTDLLQGEESNYCISIKESLHTGSAGIIYEYGIVLLDASTSQFYLCQFVDDKDRSQLETLLVQCRPKEVIYEKGRCSKEVVKLIKRNLANVMLNPFAPLTEFWDEYKSQDELEHRGYFKDGLPETLKEFVNHSAVMSAMGALVYYLRSIKIDEQLLTVGQFYKYDPLRAVDSLVLDGQALTNLEILLNSEGTSKGSLLCLLNRCVTAMGKRLFRQWICHPLYNVQAINARYDAIEDLQLLGTLYEDIVQPLSKIPDLERMISRVHSGNAKLKEFVIVLESFQSLCRIMSSNSLTRASFKSSILNKLVSGFNADQLTAVIEHVKTSFDFAKAKKDGEFQLNKGVVEEYDLVLRSMALLTDELNQYLSEQKKVVRCSELKYRDLGKELFQIEVPASYLSKVPSEWTKKSGTKNVSRFHTPVLVKKVRQYQELLETKTVLMSDLLGRVMSKFDEHYQTWKKALTQVAELDALISLATVSMLNGGIFEESCRPQLLECDTAVLDIQNFVHPCVAATSSVPFVPSDLQLGDCGDGAKIVLLSGANMSGKSTILRQSCIAIIMAQIGCFVPASSMRMTPVDRIFTRIGANDDIIAGQSTFMVELNETAKILKYATPRSLVILDELGRGTGTLDGYSIAYGVLDYLAQNVKCLGLFSTHFALLTEEFKTPLIRNMFMQSIVDGEEVIFLYKLINGVSPKSYGLNVAQMAGISSSVVAKAQRKSMQMLNQSGWIGNVGLRIDVGAVVEQYKQLKMSGQPLTLEVLQSYKTLLNL